MSKQKRKRLPVEVAIMNGDSMSGRAAALTRRRLAEVIETENVDLVLGVEYANVAGALLASPFDRFEIAQYGARGSSKASPLVMVRRSKGTIMSSRVGRRVPAKLGGRRAVNQRDRWPLHARVRWTQGKRWQRWKHRVTAVHFPPRRNWFLWPATRAALVGARPGLVGADFNKLGSAVRRAFPSKRVVMSGVLGAAIPRSIPVGNVRRVSVGGDHYVLLFTMWPGGAK